jgi:hypothetical protein
VVIYLTKTNPILFEDFLLLLFFSFFFFFLVLGGGGLGEVLAVIYYIFMIHVLPFASHS